MNTNSSFRLRAAALFTLCAWWGAAIAAQSDDCPSTGDAHIECKAKAGDQIALYVQGRDAYDRARESGDFGDALRIARGLARQNNKNGERLLKMVHLQLGWGTHKDLVQAHAWLEEDLIAGDAYVAPLMRQLEGRMSPEQLARVKSRQ